ncbi:MAG: hypothetical protein H6765_07990 [Candidatus Peribacteria bacterium]|nr:MAG: hypothetical protein H6765_07990 [Candidatus Peribacteria bacterium]
MIMLLLLCIPLASSLISITKDLYVKDSINSTTKNFFAEIDYRIELQSMEYEKIPG